MFEIIHSNNTIPLIQTDDKGKILDYRNIDLIKAEKDTGYVQSVLREMKKEKTPIPIQVFSQFQQLYLLQGFLPAYPAYLFSLYHLWHHPYFLVVAYLAFSTSRRAEQNRVWVGMAKGNGPPVGYTIIILIRLA